ncbi:MAG TPA: hypothetical protein VEZ12_20150 [Herpetosiphonaceae bacterium]|nr:hypothetical protein [Herpetosiphonaceae bacterium]
MTAMSREEILTRYRGLREISKRHQTEAVRFVPHSALLDQARRIGLAIGQKLVAESMDELTLAFDLALYTAPPARSRGIERYARSAAVPTGSDDEAVLQAMCRARFSVWQVERRHETAGLIVQDLMREESLWLVDEGLEQTAAEGMSLAMRVITPETFAMTCGVIVPVDGMLLDEVFDEVLGRIRGEADAIANDRASPRRSTVGPCWTA